VYELLSNQRKNDCDVESRRLDSVERESGKRKGLGPWGHDQGGRASTTLSSCVPGLETLGLRNTNHGARRHLLDLMGRVGQRRYGMCSMGVENIKDVMG
jgi:hypothetical protein